MSFLERFFSISLVDSPFQFTLIVAGILVIFLILSLLPNIKKMIRARKINTAIQHLGSQYLKQVILPDGLGGSIFFDYMVLAQNSIILVVLKKFSGTIFCAENIDQWTQLLGNKSYKFPNTLQQLDSDILAVSTIVKDVDVTGLVVFSSDCNFPKGKPNQVKSISEINKSSVDKQLHSELLLNAWYQLKELSNNHLSTQSFANNYFKDNQLNYKLPITISSLLVIWLIWRFSFATLTY